MKKTLSILLIFLLSTSLLCSFAYAEDKKPVEIVVNVAGGAFTINDEPAKSAAPYLSENGITMAQMDTLTTAFGAELSQNDAEIHITYTGVAMVFHVGSATAIIGENEISMPEPPTEKDGVVMMPLRFLCESFGADVSVDMETGNVTILSVDLSQGKEVDFHMLLKYGNKDSVGNSKEKWSFKTTKDFDVQTGYWRNTTFYANDISFTLSVQKNNRKITLDELYLEVSNKNNYYYDKSFSVLMEKTKGTRLGYPYVCFKERMPNMIEERHAFLTNDFIYVFDAQVPYKDLPEYRNNTTMNDILNSLRFDFTAEDDKTVDLAKKTTKIKPGEPYTDGNFRWKITPGLGFTIDEYYGFYNQVTITCPTKVELEEDNEDVNESYDYYDYYEYYEGNPTSKVSDPSLTVSAYSNPKKQTVSDWINEELTYLKSQFNPEYITVSTANDVQIEDISAKLVDTEIKFEEYTMCTKSYYLEKGNYRYILALTFDKRELDIEGFLDGAVQMVKSFTPGETDKELIGEVLVYDNYFVTDKVLKEHEFDFVKLTTPYLWQVGKYGSEGVTVYNSSRYGYNYSNGINITVKYLDYIDDEGNLKYNTFEKAAQDTLLDMRKAYPRKIRVIEPLTKTTFKDRTAYTFSFEYTEKGKSRANYILVEGKNNDYFQILIPETDMYKDTWNDQIRKQVIDTIQFIDVKKEEDTDNTDSH